MHAHKDDAGLGLESMQGGRRVHELSGCSRGGKASSTMRIDAAVWGRTRSIERERKACKKRSLYLLDLRFHQRRRHLQENARSRRSREQTTRLRKDMVKKMQHDTTRSCELPSKGSVASANYTRGEER